MEDGPERLWLNVLAILMVVALHGFFVAAEAAMQRVKEKSFDTVSYGGKWQAKYLSNVLRNQSSYLLMCQLGIASSSLVLGWMGEPAIASLIKPMLEKLHFPQMLIHIIAFLIGFTVLIMLHMTIGRQLPKNVAISKSAQITMWSALPMVAFNIIMYPLIWCIQRASNGLLRAFGLKPVAEHQEEHTEEDIKDILEACRKNGSIDKTKLLLFDNVFQFSETIAREIMIPRTEMDCLYANLSYQDNLQLAMSRMHTRYPLCETEKDHIIGFIHIKDLLKSTHSGPGQIRSLSRPLLTVPETMSIHSLLKEMQEQRTEAALLVDEYGGTSGFVTIEDILEELVGEIYDEFDDTRPSIEIMNDHTYSVDGLLQIDEFSDYFGLDMQSDDFETLGGWLYAQLEAPPKKKHSIRMNHLEFTIDEMDHLRISRITIKRLKEQSVEAPILNTSSNSFSI